VNAKDVRHHHTCTRISDSEVVPVNLDDDFGALLCTACGAQINDLPPEGDPYWDDTREE
jgi:hypothetical protein